MKLVKEIIEKEEFIWSDELGIRCCLFADRPTSETERAIALACGLSFAGIRKLESEGIITACTVDDECLHITIREDVFKSEADRFDLDRIDA